MGVASNLLGPNQLLTMKQAATLLAIFWVTAKLLKRWTAKDPFAIVPGPKPDSWLTGVATTLFTTDAWPKHKEMALKYPGIAKVPFPFGTNVLFVSDPLALNHIYVKDSYMQTRDESLRQYLTFGPGLLGTTGDQHRRQRRLMNPAFSASHLKEILPIFYRVGHKLCGSLETIISDQVVEIDLLWWGTRATLEIIGQAALGTSFDTLDPDATPHRYATTVKGLMQGLERIQVSRMITPRWSLRVGTARMRRAFIDLVSTFWGGLRAVRDMVDVMHETSLELYDKKQSAFKRGDGAWEEDVGGGRDIISVLMRANLTASEEKDKMANDEVIAAMSSFTFAGMDTTSNVICSAVLQMCKRPEIQAKAREEILEAKRRSGGEDLTYEELSHLPLLDAICRETLRLCPPLPILAREAAQDNVIRFHRPFKSAIDGKDTYELFVPKGTIMITSPLECNRSEAIWGPDGAEWKPERWLEPLPESVKAARIPGVLSNVMTFVAGEHSCIGYKFAVMEMKVLISLLLESFELRPSDKKIHWQMNGVTQPAVVKKDEHGVEAPHLSLPILVSRCG